MPPPPPAASVRQEPFDDGPRQNTRWRVDLAMAGGVLLLLALTGGVPPAVSGAEFDWLLVPLRALIGVAIVVPALAAVALSRTRPGIALVLIWVSGIAQVASFRDIFAIQIAAVIVAFGTARYGDTTLRWFSGVSLTLGAGLGSIYLYLIGSWTMATTRLIDRTGYFYRATGLQGLILFGELFAVLAMPWLLGLSLRFAGRSKQDSVMRSRAELDAEIARELAVARASRARLANDVHDVVGHSLAVIIAQADSVRFLPDTDVVRIRQAMQNISDSARQSLGEIRDVLQVTAERDAAPPLSAPTSGPHSARPHPLPAPFVGEVTTPGLGHLIETVAAAGHAVTSTSSGEPRALEAELDTTAYRVLQEMLTNALKHGDRVAPISVDLRWTERALIITVTNIVRRADQSGHTEIPSTGRGILSMRGRLARLGGTLHLETSLPDDTGAMTFTAAAHLPVGSPPIAAP